MSPQPAIAFLGLGRMGTPMATNLAKAGFPLVLHNRTHAKAEALATQLDATTAGTAREAAAAAEIVLTMLADEAALRAAYDGPDGVLAGLRPGSVAVDMGTTGPIGVARLATAVAARGGDLIDAPVSGSTAAAEAAALTVMAGGAPAAVDRVRPVLQAVGRTVYHLGPVGSGSAMKLAVNAVIFALGQAVSEALVLAERAGIDRALAYDVFENSAVAAPMVKYRHDAFLRPDDTPAAFALRLAAKDLRLITTLAADLGVPIPQATTNLQVIDAAIEAGLADHDMSAIATYLRHLPHP
ncbi:NAD(P)-dependent oxidoreductase [Streptosporangiaceae bacterium NEAU-GS5]|nr:NAD(P)-dependent oxidoreductase [Streptosporangiaceae bacterium NEAU-GS5]